MCACVAHWLHCFVSELDDAARSSTNEPLVKDGSRPHWMTHRRGRSSGAVHQLTGDHVANDGLPLIRSPKAGSPQQNVKSPSECIPETVCRNSFRRPSDAVVAIPSPLHIDLHTGLRNHRKSASALPPGILPSPAVVAPSAVIGRAQVGVMNGITSGVTSAVATPPLSPLPRENSLSSFSPVVSTKQLNIPQIPSPCPSPVHMDARRHLDLSCIARPRPRPKSIGRGRLALSPCPSPTPLSRVADAFLDHHGSDPILYNNNTASSASSPVLSPPQTVGVGSDGPSPMGQQCSQSSSSASSPTNSRIVHQTSLLDEPFESNDPKEPLQPLHVWQRNQMRSVADLEREFGSFKGNNQIWSDLEKEFGSLNS